MFSQHLTFLLNRTVYRTEFFFSGFVYHIYTIILMHFDINSGDAAKNYLQKEVEILRTKNHWKKAYFYLWDEV